jgi:2-C-methyl-D-erythritol 4-phosphate cytidylyltransferase
MGRDKIWLDVGGVPLLGHTLAAVAAAGLFESVTVVVPRAAWDRVRDLAAAAGIDGVGLVEGGERRQDSVRAGLAALPPCDLVAVHDAARPLVTTDLIRRGVEVAAQTGAAIAAMPVKDTIKRVGDGGRIVATPPREQLWAAQTPQLARRDLLERAFALADERGLTVTDEAGLLEAAGEPVTVFAGSYRNLKITTPEDLAIAAVLLGVS